MNAKVYVISICTLFLLAVVFNAIFIYSKNSSEKETFEPTANNAITEKEAKLTAVAIGEPIQSEDIYFVRWETLKNEKEKTDALSRYSVFLFSAKEFAKTKNHSLILDLIKKKKNVLVYGYRLDLKKLLDDKTDVIPYYEIQSKVPVYYYLYGIGYTNESDSFAPVALMGNFAKKEMDNHISKFLIKTFGKN